MAWVLSMIGAPLFRFFDRFMKSGMAAGLTLLIFTLLLIFIIRIFVPPLFNQAKKLSDINYEKILNGLEEPLNDTKNWLVGKGFMEDENEEKQMIDTNQSVQNEYTTSIVSIDSLLRSRGDTLNSEGINFLINIEHNDNIPPASDEESDSYFEGLKSNAIEMFNPSKIQQILSSLVEVFGSFIIALLSIFFIAFFFLKEQGLFTKMASFLVPNNQESKVGHAIEESSTLLIRYFVGLCIQVVILTVLSTLILKLLGFKNALLMGFCFSILNLIPYLGPILGNFVGVLIVVSSNLDIGFYDAMLPKIIKAIIVFGVLQLLDNFLLQPNIFSKSVKAHPLEIFLVVLMGAQIGGVLGMVIAIPVYTVLRVLAKVFFSEFEVVKKLTKEL